VLHKLEDYLRHTGGLSQVEITGIGKPSEDEMIELVRMERELESHFEDFVEKELCN
jgi:hypothetical protein